jgi:hypothetical protein
MDLIMRLALLLIGFVIAFLGLIVLIHADFVLGFIMFAFGTFTLWAMLPTFKGGQQ